AVAHGDPWTFRLYALRFGSEVYRFIFASKRKSAEIDRRFRNSVNTFRRLQLAEIQSARPLRIATVVVGPDDTVERLAKRMAVSDRPVERFRVLNGLEPGQKLTPGERVKIVVE